jgi:hypothetical protein
VLQVLKKHLAINVPFLSSGGFMYEEGENLEDDEVSPAAMSLHHSMLSREHVHTCLYFPGKQSFQSSPAFIGWRRHSGILPFLDLTSKLN